MEKLWWLRGRGPQTRSGFNVDPGGPVTTWTAGSVPGVSDSVGLGRGPRNPRRGQGCCCSGGGGGAQGFTEATLCTKASRDGCRVAAAAYAPLLRATSVSSTELGAGAFASVARGPERC